MASPSAWTAKALGGTTSSSSGCGAASSTRRCICGPTKASERREIRSAGISNFTTAEDRIRALTATPRIKPTSPRCRSAGQPNLGRGSTYRRGDSVQTIGTSSHERDNWLLLAEGWLGLLGECQEADEEAFAD